MLNQISGLPDDASSTGPVELQFEPGTSWQYSNANFDLLDFVVEAADGRAFPAFVSEEFAKPLGLTSLEKCGERTQKGSNDARRYTAGKGSLSPVDGPCWFRGTAVELVTWMDALMRGQVVSSAGVEGMTTPARLADGSEWPYGYGLDLRRD